MNVKSSKYILWYKDIFKEDIPLVGGKNASLGEMFSKLVKKGVNVPNGFAMTTKAYRHFLESNKLDNQLKEIFAELDPKSFESLKKTGSEAQQLILNGKFPSDLAEEIIAAYHSLGKKYGPNSDITVAIRSSAVCEDMPQASFAGQFETFLNVSGEKRLLEAIKECFASTFTERAISYREKKGIAHLRFALSIGIQKMVRSDLACSGVIFTLDTETGFPDIVLINSVYGVGEMIVKGRITPDEFCVFKPTLKRGYKAIITRNLGRKNKKYIYNNKSGGLKEVSVSPEEQLKFSISDDDALTLARWACLIEEHYGRPQDIEWAKDGLTGQLFIVQARPETIYAAKKERFYEKYELSDTTQKPILTGIAVGSKITRGKTHIISDVSEISRFKSGQILVTRMTDPDWVPAIKIASAVITDEGSRTCHAAIVSRELGIPAIVGTKKATRMLKNEETVTVDCASKIGKIFHGEIPFGVKKYNLEKIPKLKTKIMVNIGAPEIAFKTSFLPHRGVGLARIEFILNEKIRVHPLALYHYEKIKSGQVETIAANNGNGNNGKKNGINFSKIIADINRVTGSYQDKKQFFIDKLSEGIAEIAGAFWPEQVIVRLSDFKTNEYRNLIGGEIFEGAEANPMLGFRGACRYLDKDFQPAFSMECRAIKKAREEFGLKNIVPMVPFCRTPEEGKNVLALMEKFGLKKSSPAPSNKDKKDRLKVYVMCEIPSNVILAEEFLDIFDGMSIGSNDLTQLTLGLDRDNGKIAHIGDERNQAVKKMVRKVIKLCRERKKYCGICGQAPSDYSEFAEFLVKEGIESISLNSDTVIKTIFNLAKIVKKGDFNIKKPAK